MHVYYAKVARDLMLGHATYARDYRIARPFPPYSIHAYLLMAIGMAVSSETSEKLLACLTLIVTAGGLGYLAKQLGRSVPWACALSAPFLLNRFVFLGFYGYMIGIGLAMITAGLWLRRRTNADRIAMVALTALTLFAHPVPYLVIVGFCWTELVSGWWNARNGVRDEQTIRHPVRADVVAVTIATLLFLYVKAYSHSGMLWNYEWLADVGEKIKRLWNVFRTWDELPLVVPSYNWAAAIALAAATLAACSSALRQSRPGRVTRVQFVVGWSFLLLLLLPFLPYTMNGSGFFAARFAILPPLLLFAAAAAFPLRGKRKAVVAIASVAICGFCLAVLNANVRPIAQELDDHSVPVNSLSGSRLIALNNSTRNRALTFDPYEWAAVRLVDRSGAILSDAPWMDLQIMMLEEIGPKVQVGQRGPQVVSGEAVRVGLVTAHCGTPPSASAVSNFARSGAAEWRMLSYGCYEILQPR